MQQGGAQDQLQDKSLPQKIPLSRMISSTLLGNDWR
jgi:hypothetical protein